MKEVIRKEGDAIILYSSDGKKVLGRFPFGEGEKYENEETARAAAEKRERQIQFFKHREAAYRLERLAEQGDIRNIIEAWRDWVGSLDEGKWPAEEALREQAVALALSDEALKERLLSEVGRRHTQREFQIIEEVIRLMAELHGEIEDLETLLTDVEEAAGVPNVADVLEACIHRSFTIQADNLLERGRIDREERITLSSMIGDALDVFSGRMDDELAELRTRPRYEDGEEEATPVYASAPPPDVPDRSLEEKSLTDVWDRSLTEARIDDQGNLSGVIVVEGLSANGNFYTREALESGVEIFAGKPIYADHPTRTEERERPERSVRDLVGRLPGRESLSVEALSETDGRLALKYRGGRLSETAGWLATLIREKIAGDQSINASGRGRDQDNQFVVEAFTAATSLDFVTRAAAGGYAQLAEAASSDRTLTEDRMTAVLGSLTLAQLAKARPDILDLIAQREREKVYGSKDTVQNLQEALKVAEQDGKQLQADNDRLKEELTGLKRKERERRAGEIVTGVLAESDLPEHAQTRVRRLVEADVGRFAEADPVPADPPSTDDGEPEHPPETPGEAMTEDELKQAAEAAVKTEREYLAQVTGAGRITGMGGTSSDEEAREEEKERRIKAYENMGLSEAEAKIAVEGRV